MYSVGGYGYIDRLLRRVYYSVIPNSWILFLLDWFGRMVKKDAMEQDAENRGADQCRMTHDHSKSP